MYDPAPVKPVSLRVLDLAVATQPLIPAVVTALYPALAEPRVVPVPDRNSIALQDVYNLMSAVGPWGLLPIQPFQQTLVVRS